MLTIMPAVAAAVVVSLSSVATLAQDYPRRPLRLIAPFPPGGGVDFLARIIGQKMTENWDQQVVIDNRSGGSGIIGMEIAARAGRLYDTHERGRHTEQGYTGYDTAQWIGMLVPKATAKFIVTKLHAESVRILALPDVRDRLKTAGVEAVGNTPDAFAAQIRADTEKYGKLAAELGIRLD